MLYTQAITMKNEKIQKKKLRVLNEFSYRGIMRHLHQAIQRHHQNGAELVALEFHAGRRVWTISSGEVREGYYSRSKPGRLSRIACLDPVPVWESGEGGLPNQVVQSLDLNDYTHRERNVPAMT